MSEKSQNNLLWILLGLFSFAIIAFGVHQLWFVPQGAVTIPASENDSTIEVEKKTVEQADGSMKETQIFETDGVRHSVPLSEIRSGGPPRDGIPSIDDPKFISIAEAENDLSDEERGIAIDINGEQRFYPFQILVWHEIVNDTVGGERILVTYCPLCLSAFVFDPVVDGERVEFGTSGKLWNSNLIMYDRKTESYWSQILGEAIVGSETGEFLTLLPSDLVLFGNWKNEFPEGDVLSRDTGAIRFYGNDPYGEGFQSPFPVNFEDDRLPRQEFVMGVVINGESKAYVPSAVKKVGTLEDEVGGEKIEVQYVESLDVVRFFRVNENGARERFNPFSSFWYSWVAAHPDTDLYSE